MAGMLEEDNGNKSTMRAMSLLLVLSAIVSGGWILYMDIQSEMAGQIFFGFLFFGVMGKAGQKALELYLQRKAP